MVIFDKLKALLTRAERKQMLVLLFLMFIGMGLETLGLGLVIPAIGMMTQTEFLQHNVYLQPILRLLHYPSQAQLIIGAMLSLVMIYTIKAAFLIFMSWKQSKFVYGLQASLSYQLFSGYLKQPWSFHLQRNSAQLISNITNEVSQLVNSVVQPGMILLTEGGVLVGVGALLFAIEPLGACIVLSVLGGASIASQRLIRGYLTRWGETRQYHDGLRMQHLQQGLGGAKDVKLLGREAYFLKDYQTHNVGSAEVSQKYRTMTDFPRLWLELLGMTGLAMLVLMMLAQNKPVDLIIPTLGLFAAAAFRLMPSLNRVLTAVQALRYARPTLNRLFEEIKIAHADDKNHTTYLPVTFNKNLSLQHIQYKYKGASHDALQNISLNFEQGKSIGFIGTSGAGKSTLVDIILGLLTPEKGQVLVDGVDIHSNLRGWQDQIGYVPQSIFLTDDTLRRNVAFGLPDELINETAVLNALKSAQLLEFVVNLPDGLNTYVGERGVRLSGGQRQRIGIARALYHDPAILVLDEATSSLDSATEKEVMKAVNALHGEKTLIIVAHRMSTVEHCDWIYKMVKGRILTEGKFEHVVKELDSQSILKSEEKNCVP